MSKHILVTGGLGFIGSHFVNYLMDNTNYSVTILDKNTYASDISRIHHKFPSNRLCWVHEDICDISPDYCWTDSLTHIVNFAAETHVDNSIENSDPFVHTNVNGTVNLLEIAKHKNLEFIQISTDEVYGDTAGHPTSLEIDTLHPSSPYSASKAAADMFVEAYGRTHGVKYKIIRASNNYGPGQHKEKLIPKAIECLNEGKKIPVYGTGLQERQWLHVQDFVKAIHIVMYEGHNGQIYNVGGDNIFTNLELLQEIIHTHPNYNGEGWRDYIEFVEDRKGHDFAYHIDSTKIRLLGWEPRKNFRQSIETYISGQSRQ